MNNSLEKYEKNQKVCTFQDGITILIFLPNMIVTLPRGMNCWGWGTWLDRWKHFEKKPKKLLIIG